MFGKAEPQMQESSVYNSRCQSACVMRNKSHPPNTSDRVLPIPSTAQKTQQDSVSRLSFVTRNSNLKSITAPIMEIVDSRYPTISQ